MRLWLVSLLVALLSSQQLQAYPLLQDLPLQDGKWELVGVPLHNFKLIPLQQQLGTFIVRDVQLMKQLQADWDFPLKLSDYCDYHYMLKFYHDGKLVKSLKVNLVCNYITEGSFSYAFDPTSFEAFKANSISVQWARVRYQNLSYLRHAFQVMKSKPGIYFYQDMQPYLHDGYFVVSVKGQPTRVNRDSLRAAVGRRLATFGDSSNYYVSPYLFTQDKDGTLNFRYKIYCDENFAEDCDELEGCVAPWRSHLDEDEFVQIIIVGITEEKYWRLMR